MDGGFACFQISEITALKGSKEAPPWSPCWDNEGLYGLRSREEAGHLGPLTPKVMRWLRKCGDIPSSPQGMYCLTYYSVFSTQGSTHLRLCINMPFPSGN